MGFALPPPAIETDVYEVVSRGTLFGQAVYNVFHFRNSAATGTGGTAAQALTLAINCSTNWFTPWSNCCSTDFKFDKVLVRPLTNPTVVDQVILYGGTRQGSVEEDGLPSQVAAIVKRVSAFRSRSAQGRSFIAGLPLTASVEGIIDGPYLTLLGTLAIALDANITAAGVTYVPIILSRKSSNLGVPPIIVRGADVNQHSVVSVFGIQRRRRVGSGI